MERFTASTAPSVDALNKVFAVDAVVDPTWGTTSGFTYPTVTAALAAGHKAIYIKPGSSTEDVTISTSGVHLMGSGISWTTDGSRVRSITLASGVERVIIENVTAVNATSHGFNLAGQNNYCRFVNCVAYACTGNGFQIGSQVSGLVFDGCWANANVINFNVPAPTGTEWFDDVSFNQCRSFYAKNHGFAIVTGGTGTATVASFKFTGCHSSFSAQVTSGHGFSIGPRASASLIGCHATNNGAGGGITGVGFYSNALAIFSHQYVGCIARNNNDNGFHCSIASTKVSIVGCHSVGNLAPYVNCGSCPGVLNTGTYGANGSG